MYPKEYYTKVKDDLAALRLKYTRELDERRADVLARQPRLREIEERMRQMYQSLGLEIIEGNGDPLALLHAREAETKALQQEQVQLLKELGLPRNYLQMKYACSVCHDKGVTGNRFCTCFRERLAKMAARESNLSAILDTQNFDYFDFSYYSTQVDPEKGYSPRKNIKNVFAVCLKFVKNFDVSRENLFLFGPAGLGKTFLSSCIAKDLLDRGKSVFYQSAPNIFRMMEDYKFGRGNAAQLSAAIDRIYQCDLLIIDDLGTEMATSFSASALFDIVNERLLRGKKTVINSNMDNNELRAVYSDRVVSRLMGNYTQLEVFGGDIRLMKAGTA